MRIWDAHRKKIEITSLVAALFWGLLVFSSLERVKFAAVSSAVFTESIFNDASSDEKAVEEKANQQKVFLPTPLLDADSYLVRLVGDDAPILKLREGKPLPPAKRFWTR